MNQAFASVDGDECSWSDIGILIQMPGAQTIPWTDVEALKTGRKVDVGESRGTSGGRIMKTTAGAETDEASITVTRSGHAVLTENLEKAAAALGLTRGDEVAISGVRFGILAQWTPLGSSRIYQTRLTGCRFLGDSNDNKQGTDADTIEITLNPIKIATMSATGKWIVLR